MQSPVHRQATSRRASCNTCGGNCVDRELAVSCRNGDNATTDGLLHAYDLRVRKNNLLLRVTARNHGSALFFT